VSFSTWSGIPGGMHVANSILVGLVCNLGDCVLTTLPRNLGLELYNVFSNFSLAPL